MGRHALPDPGPAAPTDDIPGWGTFATALAASLAGWAGDGWPSALPVAALGGGATVALWIAVQVTHRNVRAEALPRRPGGRRARVPGAGPEGGATDVVDTTGVREPGGVRPGA